MKLSERSIRIKELISGQVDMGTFGLVELELIEFDKELHELKKLSQHDVIKNEVAVCDCMQCGRKITNFSEAYHCWLCDDC